MANELVPFPQSELNQVMDEFAGLFQSRTAFQLDNFVLRQHDTEPMQYLQLCMELSGAMQSYETSVLMLEKNELRAQRLLESNNPEKRIEGKIQQVNNRYGRTALTAKARELQLLIEMYRAAKKFTREEIEADQANYWNRRLTRQAIGERTSGSPGNFYAMWEAGMIDPATLPPAPSIIGPSSLRGEIEE